MPTLTIGIVDGVGINRAAAATPMVGWWGGPGTERRNRRRSKMNVRRLAVVVVSAPAIITVGEGVQSWGSSRTPEERMDELLKLVHGN